MPERVTAVEAAGVAVTISAAEAVAAVVPVLAVAVPALVALGIFPDARSVQARTSVAGIIAPQVRADHASALIGMSATILEITEIGTAGTIITGVVATSLAIRITITAASTTTAITDTTAIGCIGVRSRRAAPTGGDGIAPAITDFEISNGEGSGIDPSNLRRFQFQSS
ncbi:hypothetical protein [Hyphomicrobium sp. 2TAF46]|uniref:hypothetical protein n=1 Tax=Hyphomicrobium sp. 2TAF46 TaxID=3233019 RepID=UPI003F90FFB2